MLRLFYPNTLRPSVPWWLVTWRSPNTEHWVPHHLLGGACKKWFRKKRSSLFQVLYRVEAPVLETPRGCNSSSIGSLVLLSCPQYSIHQGPYIVHRLRATVDKKIVHGSSGSEATYRRLTTVRCRWVVPNRTEKGSLSICLDLV